MSTTLSATAITLSKYKSNDLHVELECVTLLDHKMFSFRIKFRFMLDIP